MVYGYDPRLLGACICGYNKYNCASNAWWVAFLRSWREIGREFVLTEWSLAHAVC